MTTYRKILIRCLGAVVVVLVIGYGVLSGEKSSHMSGIVSNKQDLGAQNLNLVNQLYTVSVPIYFDTHRNKPTSFVDGKIELHGPQLLEDGTTDKDGPQDVLYWAAYVTTDNNTYTVADVNGDGVDDVVSVLVDTGGGSCFFYHLVVFLNVDGHLKYLTSQYLGDRIKVNSISYNSGIIQADIITQGPDEPYCCGTMPALVKFRLDGDHLILTKGNSIGDWGGIWSMSNIKRYIVNQESVFE